MKLLYRIIAAPLLAVVCLLSGCLFTTSAINGIVSKFATLRDAKLSAARSLAQVDSTLANVNALLYRTITIIDTMDAGAIQAVRARIQSESDSALATLRLLEDRIDPAVVAPWRGVIDEVGKYKGRAQQALTMAESSPGAAVAILASAESSYKTSAKGLTMVSESVNADVGALSKDVIAVAERTQIMLFVLALTAAVLSVGAAWWIARRLTAELSRAVGISEAVAIGQLHMDVPVGGRDEVGRLLDSLRTTVHRLADSLRRIQDAAGSIHTASSEIAAGSQDLSQRTERTAGSLQQTTGTVGLLSSMVDQGTRAAVRASELAESAVAVASRGGSLVAEVVATMQDLQAGAHEIGTIIGTVDAIAFQTNILALNAAVEAARAGEQGRGFAVVASEVRQLAQRSAEAAKQIKLLVGKSVARAEAGSHLVGQAGQTMHEIVASVAQVNAVVSDIASRAGQQNEGIGGVNQALSSLDQMTQQNAALAEQSTAAAESLRRQAAGLAQAVNAFRFRA